MSTNSLLTSIDGKARVKKFVVLAVIIVLISRCGPQNSKWEGKLYDEQGIPVIDSRGPGIWGNNINEKIKFEENLALGLEEGKEHLMFHSELEITVDSDLNIYVLDIRNHRLLKFDKKGEFICMAGRKGQGPGELQQPYKVKVNPSNEIYILDGFSRIHIFDTNGKYLKTIILKGSHRDFQFLPDGRIFCNTVIPRKTGIAASFISTDGELLEKFPIEYQYGPEISGSGYIGGEFRFIKDQIYLVLPDKYEIREYDIKGNLLSKIRRDFEFTPPEVKRLEGGFIISKKTTLGPCFLSGDKFLINEVFIVKGETEKDYELKIYLDFFNEKKQFLGSFELPAWTKLIYIDSKNNFYFVKLSPFPKIMRATLSLE